MRLLQIGLIVTLTQKLFIALAIDGAGTKYEGDAKAFFESWDKRVPSACLPAFDRMGGVWSEWQYNHQNERGKKPPIRPWRIEVADPSQGARTMFLHVFEITDENNQTPTAIKLIEPEGVQIGDRWQVRFNASGPLAGRVGDRALSTEIHTESQYQ